MDNELPSSLFPLTLYGSGISYFTGKFEVYCRLKGIPYRVEGLQFPRQHAHFTKTLGVGQMPTVACADGTLMTDTTVMIEWFEQRMPTPPILPAEPALRFWSQLLEDYADEWLWRPAMHFRWHYPEGAYLQSRVLAAECAASVRAPGFIKRWNIRQRQRGSYTRGDGITQQAVAGVEHIYLDLLAQLDTVFETRPWIMGDRPSLTDVAFAGPFLRHFATDPVPLAIMRDKAPRVHEWIARLWRAGPPAMTGELAASLPADLLPLLERVGTEHLSYLDANARAVSEARAEFDVSINGVTYEGAWTSRYRVWCLWRLRRLFESLPDASRAEVQAVLEQAGCWDPLWAADESMIEGYAETELPFRAKSKMVGVNE